jgi:hypothetical protein
MLDNMRRIHPRNAANRGVCVDAEGAMLGPDCVLVHRVATGFRELEREEAATVQRVVLNDGLGPDWLFDQSRRIAQALSSGQIALAQIYGLYIPINGLDDQQLQRLGAIAKAGFNPDEPRVPKGDPRGGEWTSGDDGGGGDPERLGSLDAGAATSADIGHDNADDDSTPQATAYSITTPNDAAITGDSATADIETEGSDNPPIKCEIRTPESSASGSPSSVGTPEIPQLDAGDRLIPLEAGFVGGEAEWLAALTPATTSALRQMLLQIGGASLVLGFLFIPANRSSIVEGPIDGSPDFSYRFDGDMGILQLRQDIGSLGPVVVDEGHIGADGLFRDAQGRVIGRYLSGSGVIIDAGALPGFRMLPHGATAPDAGADEATQPKLCPDETPEDITRRSERALAYQEQISGLGRGLQVKLNGVSFDGCRDEDGTMLEAKGPGFADKMQGSKDWLGWFRGDEEIEDQMARQSKAAIGRRIEWHFAERPVADYFRKFAEEERLKNIVVIHTPAEVP